jgi:hypothetical protein
VEQYNDSLVREFYANLNTTIIEPDGAFYHSVFVRESLVAFSPEDILAIFDIPYNSTIIGLGEDVNISLVCQLSQEIYFICRHKRDT